MRFIVKKSNQCCRTYRFDFLWFGISGGLGSFRNVWNRRNKMKLIDDAAIKMVEWCAHKVCMNQHFLSQGGVMGRLMIIFDDSLFHLNYNPKTIHYKSS